MAGRIEPGDRLPTFRYDTPFTAQAAFKDLLAAEAPLVLVFMGNFGHPVTRVFAQRYRSSMAALKTGGLALVVRSQAAALARSLPKGALPYELICDARGVLYNHLEIPEHRGVGVYSLEALQIMHDAKEKGYRARHGAAQQLPLTLVLDSMGTVLFRHYGTTLTDVPADCGAIQQILDSLRPAENRFASAAAMQTAAADLYDPPVHEYAKPELDKTRVDGIFDDPYGED